MPRTCTVCNHPDREAIDHAMINSVSLRNISVQYALSTTALHRHKTAHLSASVTKAKEASDATHGDNLLEEIRKIQKATLNILITTYNGGDYRTTLMAVREARGNLELMGKLLGEIAQTPTVNVLVTSNDWLRMRTAILTALEPYPEARLTVSEAIRGLPGG